MRSSSRNSLLGLALLAACSQSPAGPPDGPVGTLRVTATTTGAGAKPTLLQLLVDDDPAVIIDANGSHEFEGVTVGDLVARVVVPGHCTADHYAPRTVEIVEDEVAELSWSIRCPLPTAPGIASTRGSVAWITDVDGSSGGPIGGAPGLEAYSSFLNPARTRIAYEQPGNSALAFVDVDGGAAVTTELQRINFMDWSPDGQRLLVVLGGASGIDGGELLLVWADGVVERTIRPSGVKSARWAPDGRRIAYREGAYIFVEDLQTGARLNTQHLHVNGDGGEPAWSPDGTRLAFVDTYQESIRVMDADGGNPRVVATFSSFQGNTYYGGIDWGENDLLLVLRSGPPAFWGARHVVPSSGGNPVPLVNDGGDHQWARWAQ